MLWKPRISRSLEYLAMKLSAELTPGGGWLSLSSFRGHQNEYQLAGVLCRSEDPSRIVPIAKKSASAAPTLRTEYGPDGWMDGWKLSRKAYHFGIAYRSVVSLSSSASFVELHHLPTPCFVPPDIYLQDVHDPPATSSSWNCLNPERLLTATHLFLSFSHLWNHFPYSQSQLLVPHL